MPTNIITYQKYTMISTILNEVITIKQSSKSEGNYNIFNLLDLNYRENKLHTAILADLLNPYGSHGLGIHFLKKFWTQLLEIDLNKLIPELNDIIINNLYNQSKIRVTVNKYIGVIDKNYTKGGYIDIEIKMDSFLIIIENKIYATDQRNQLFRYKEYGRNNCAVLYLTLDGKQAPIESTNNSMLINQDYFAISYKDFVLEWIKNSLKDIDEKKSELKSTLLMYLNTISMLTEHKISSTISEIQNTLLEDKEKFKIIPDIIKAYEYLKLNIDSTFQNKLKVSYGSEKEIISYQGHHIFSSYGTLNQLFYLSFYLKKDGIKVGRQENSIFFETLSDKIKGINNREFKSDNWDLAYKPIAALNGKRIIDLDPEILHDYTNEENIDTLVSSVIAEMEWISEEIKKILSNT